MPAVGDLPVTTAIDETQYKGSVVWLDENDNDVTGRFAKNIYKAVVTLTAQDGYTFTGVSAGSFTYTGARSVTNNVNSGEVTINFYITAIQAIQACCWWSNTAPPFEYLLTGHTDGWKWGCDGNDATRTSWPEELNVTEQIEAGWPNIAPAYGHWFDLEGLDLAPAHFLTIDLGQEKDIFSLDYLPIVTGVNYGGYFGGNLFEPFGKGEIYVSSTVAIGVDPDVTDVTKAADFAFSGITENNWLEIDIAAQNSGNSVRGRYVQIRFTALSKAMDHVPGDPLNGAVSGLRLRVE